MSTVGQKRPHEESEAGNREDNHAEAAGTSSKRPRREDDAAIVVHSSSTSSSALTTYQAPLDPLAAKGGRTSTLASPNYLLGGHQAAVLGARFSPSGNILATCSRDRSVLLWRLAEGEDPENYCQLIGHKNAILGVAWGREPANEDQSQHLYTASADQTGGVWNAENGERIRKLVGHTKTINAISSSNAKTGPEMVATASDDATCKLWDCRSRNAAHTFSDGYPLTSVALADDGTVFAAGIEGVIKQWDVRKGSVVMSLTGHRDMITGMSLSPDGNTLLSFAMDGALRAWDVRPFFTSPTAAAAASSSSGGTFVVPAAAPHQGPGVSERCVKVSQKGRKSYGK
jgi:Prp8 binding protein